MSRLPLDRRARLVFAGATVAYLCAVTQRTSLGVAGVAATDRFAASAAALSTLGVLQLVVYAALQVPVGVLVDRFGPKAVMTVGAVLMIAGQVVVAVAPTLPPAVAGRMLVGAGDATTFVAALRLLNAWFVGSRVPVLTQWFGNLGQIGQVLSLVPFAALLHLTGWTTSFLTAAGLSGIALVAILALVANSPDEERTGPVDLRAALRALGGGRYAGRAPASASGHTSSPSRAAWCSPCSGVTRSWSPPSGCRPTSRPCCSAFRWCRGSWSARSSAC